MKSSNQLTILSTYAKDIFVDENGLVVKEQEGGPAFYLLQTFEKEKINFSINLAKSIDVKIKVVKNEEFGKIEQDVKFKRINFSNVKTPYLVISTISNEFDISNLNNYYGRVFLDVQGYVRNGKKFGQKKRWQLNKKIADKIYCLKCTKEELNYLSSDLVDEQKKKILLVTNGEYGCEAFIFGRKYVFKPNRVISSVDTVGAGDTFFANFIAKLIKRGDSCTSLKYAIEKTSDFLLNK